MGQKVCSPDCAISLAVSERGKAVKVAQVKERRADAIKRESQRTMPQLKKIAQTAFNGFVRARDAGKPCISCGVPLPSMQIGGAFDCGHYRSVGSAPHMRYVEDNAHGQCKKCNRYLSGNVADYRARLLNRIGPARLDALEADQTLRKYTIDDLKAIKATYQAKTNQLKESQE